MYTPETMTVIATTKFRAGTRGRRGERGQTILLVAISIVSLLMMAALAIDVVSLYVASAEIQRSADAAALVGAKAVADSGVTTLQSTDGNLGNAEILAQAMATSAINGIVQATPAVNSVVGGTPVLVGTPTVSWAQGNGNPHITVTLQQTNLPTFFARVFGSKSATATASATAEAYNPANQQSFTPIQTTCVKPWLIGNLDPITSSPFVTNTATGQVEDAVGEKQFWLSSDCNRDTIDNCFALTVNPPGVGGVGGPNPFVQFVPLQVTTNAGDVCPPSTASPCGGLAYDLANKLAIECCNITPYTCGGTVPNANWTQNLNPEYQGASSDLALGTECLIHASNESTLQGQDSLDWSTAPFPTGPPRITAGSGPEAGKQVSTSGSIVTIPIVDTSGLLPTTPPRSVNVVGFLQAFVNSVDDLGPGRHGDVSITVLNVIGCSTAAPANNPVVGGNGASPIPVRLITPP